MGRGGGGGRQPWQVNCCEGHPSQGAHPRGGGAAAELPTGGGTSGTAVPAPHTLSCCNRTPCLLQVVKEPREVQRERAAEAAAANLSRRAEAAAKNESKAKMKGKNRPTRRRKKKQDNIIEERKPGVKARMREQGVATAEYGWRKQQQGQGQAAARQQGQQQEEGQQGGGGAAAALEGVPRALHRFHKRG